MNSTKQQEELSVCFWIDNVDLWLTSGVETILWVWALNLWVLTLFQRGSDRIQGIYLSIREQNYVIPGKILHNDGQRAECTYKENIIYLFVPHGQARYITRKDMSKPRQKISTPSTKINWAETKTLQLKLKFLTFQSLCLTSCPSFSNNLLPYFIRWLFRPVTAADTKSSLSIFPVWNGEYWCSRTRQSFLSSFFLRKHGKKTMSMMIGSQCLSPRASCELREFVFLLSCH